MPWKHKLLKWRRIFTHTQDQSDSSIKLHSGGCTFACEFLWHLKELIRFVITNAKGGVAFKRRDLWDQISHMQSHIHVSSRFSFCALGHVKMYHNALKNLGSLNADKIVSWECAACRRHEGETETVKKRTSLFHQCFLRSRCKKEASHRGNLRKDVLVWIKDIFNLDTNTSRTQGSADTAAPKTTCPLALLRKCPAALLEWIRLFCKQDISWKKSICNEPAAVVNERAPGVRLYAFTVLHD